MIPVRLTVEVEAQLNVRRAWWRKNRDKAPDLFDGELAETIERIGRAPESFPVFIELRGHVIRRCLMPRSRCYLYIEVERNHVVVLGAAGSRQRRPPRFKLHETP